MSREEVVARWLAHNDGQKLWHVLPEALREHYFDQAASLLDHINVWLIPE